MKRRYLKKVFSVMLILTFVVSIFAINFNTINAATAYKYIEKKTKVGNYYVWCGEKGIYVSKSKTGKGTRIVKSPSSSTKTCLGRDLVTNGSKVYYAISSYTRNDCVNKSEAMKIYKIDVTGKNNTYIGKVTHGDYISGYYNGYIYIARHQYNRKYCSPVDSDTYRFNLKTKKLTLVKKDFSIRKSSGYYYLGHYNCGDAGPFPLYLHNAKTNKTYKITSSSGWAYRFLNGKIYYPYLYNYYGNNGKTLIKSCSYRGSNQKTLCTVSVTSSTGNIVSIESTYVKYCKYDKNYNSVYYKKYYKTGKIVKTTK